LSTSGSWDFGQTGTQLIQAVYEDLGVVLPGGTISSARSTLALDRLNKLLKQYQGTSDGAPGIKINTRQRVTLALAKGQQSYLIGPASTDARASTAMGRTTLSADEAASQTTLSITLNTDTTTYPGTTITMTASDFIGIELNDGTIHWTTISGTPGATADIATGLASAASSGNYVWWFTSRAQRFPAIEAAVLRSHERTDVELEIYRDVRQYELGIADKYADGAPYAILVEPLRTQTRVTLSSQPTDVTDQIVLTVLYPAEDVDAAANDIAFPQEALRFLHYELMFALAFPMRVQWTAEYEKARTEARTLYFGLNPENTVVYFQPGVD
jgi:hypothetical protein